MNGPKPINGLPYRIRVYINGQVLIPASVVRLLGIEWARYARVIIRHSGRVIELRRVLLLKTRNTASRQFTIPRSVRLLFNIRPLDEVEVLSISPLSSDEFEEEFRVVNHG
ncbi:hypothetical protein VMUT_1949 [Vulcanisaeta moutnovskia 768-28]|uniref:AbrB family transcriptional regulator n=1 Tax=Vulcanisaeta moutnovskia (strain 768-28) TaxID=985053 RepID=F0QW55_VULM7|nr:hypothetical protein [Vulcanisaeta moutnovskia]ADY02150.1 hypothetical protein VMUT_1949 [Vulcanisaeta moutnovskia 768-28]